MDKIKLIEYSKEVGIDIIAVTDSEQLHRIEEYLFNRVENNLVTEFEESVISKRINPKEVMSECKSIIVVGVSYNQEYKSKKKVKIKGSLSKSSWGEDYHTVLHRKMEKLINRILEDESMNFMIFSDTGPLVDRELAYKSGIGYYGKNCSIINKDYGSFIFLGYILTDIFIESDRGNLPSECGECTLCIDACPTGALDEFRLNPKKCISYLTQTKDLIPEELARKMGIKVYGCDTCQIVCPKNIGKLKNLNPEFIPTETHGMIDIEELIFMTKNDFKEKYGSMSGSWRGKNVLIRNALIALANISYKGNGQLLDELKSKKSPLLDEYIKRLEDMT